MSTKVKVRPTKGLKDAAVVLGIAVPFLLGNVTPAEASGQANFTGYGEAFRRSRAIALAEMDAQLQAEAQGYTANQCFRPKPPVAYPETLDNRGRQIWWSAEAYLTCGIPDVPPPDDIPGPTIPIPDPIPNPDPIPEPAPTRPYPYPSPSPEPTILQ